jgi:hypothetical protein
VLAYALSLPERVVRWVAALLGTVLLGATRVLPRRVREGRFFRIAVERQIKLLADDLGQAGLFPAAAAVDTRSATRMAVGGMADNLLLIGLHASPVWMLLAATDVSAGARRFLEELGRELKDAGVMAEGSRLDRLDDVLGGLSRLSERLADAIDMPPLGVAEMKATVATLRDELGATGASAASAADLDALADDVRGLADHADRGLLETAAALALGTARGAGSVAKGVVVGTGATIGIVGRHVWEDVVMDYGRTIRKVYRRGFTGSLGLFLRPLTRSHRRGFAWRFLTFTEIALSLGRWRRAEWRA